MDSSHIALVVAIVILITLSAYFSATETAFSALNRVRMKNLAADGNKRAALALSLSENYDKLLSTILIGNNIVNITSASLATVLFVAWFKDAGVTLSTVVMTILVLIFGEISPKSLAKDSPERFAMFSAPILRVFLTILTPVNFLFMQWKRLLSRVFKAQEDRGITEEELLTLVEEAQHEGGIGHQEGELIRSAIEFNDLDAEDVLTPRVDIIAVSDADTPEAISEIFWDSGYSRLPVYHGSIDNVVGVIHEKDFHREVLIGQKPVASILHSALFIAPSLKISELLGLLQKTQSHLAVVADEYGGTLGVVTLEDILEELVGEIWDEHDEAVSELTKIDDHVYLVLCGIRLEKFYDEFDLGDAPEDITSVGGWVIDRMGRIPNEGDRFTYQNLTVVVLHTDCQRVLEIRVEVSPAGEPAESA